MTAAPTTLAGWLALGEKSLIEAALATEMPKLLGVETTVLYRSAVIFAALTDPKVKDRISAKEAAELLAANGMSKSLPTWSKYAGAARRYPDGLLTPADQVSFRAICTEGPKAVERAESAGGEQVRDTASKRHGKRGPSRSALEATIASAAKKLKEMGVSPSEIRAVVTDAVGQ